MIASAARPSSTAKMNGQYEPLPPFLAEVPGAVVVVCAAGRTSTSGSLVPSACVRARPWVRCDSARARASAAVPDPVLVGPSLVDPPLADRRLAPGLRAAAPLPASALATARAFCRGAGRNGNAFVSRAGSACAVTHTGVWVLVRE